MAVGLCSCCANLSPWALSTASRSVNAHAAAAIITASRPIELRFSGHSFFHRNSIKSTAAIGVNVGKNAIAITEGGTVRCKPDANSDPKEAPCVYDGMTTVLSASRSFANTVSIEQDDRGVHHYQFTVPCDEKGTVVSWAMHDDSKVAVKSARDIIKQCRSSLLEKTTVMNRLLNEEVPWFRCPDERFVDVYYYLWSLYLMYYIEVDDGWER